MNKYIYSISKIIMVLMLTASIFVGTSCSNETVQESDETQKLLTELRSMGSISTAHYYGDVVLYTSYLPELEVEEGVIKSKVNSLLKKVHLKDEESEEEKLSKAKNQQMKNINELIYVTKGEFVVGFDMSQLADDALVFSESGVTLVLPAPTIISSKIDVANRFYEKGTWTSEDENNFKNEAEDLFVKQVTETGILQEAEETGIQQMTILLKAMGYENVVVVNN